MKISIVTAIKSANRKAIKSRKRWQWFGMPGLISRLITYWPIQWSNGSVVSTHLPIKLPPLGVKNQRLHVKSGFSDALKPCRLGLSCKAPKNSDIGTGGLRVLPTHAIYNSKKVTLSHGAPRRRRACSSGRKEENKSQTMTRYVLQSV